MVNLVPLVLPDDKFDRIYAIIKPYIQGDTLTKNDLHQDLYNIIIGAYQKDWVNDFENGPTVAERKKIISGFAYELEALHKRYINIKKYYPDLIDPETNNTREQIPEWLSFFTNQIDFNNCKKMASQLREFQKQGDTLTSKERLSGRSYYLKALEKVFSKYTGKKPQINKNYDTPFSKFFFAFVENTHTLLKIPTISTSALYDVSEKSKK